jgi:hypothetical protein
MHSYNALPEGIEMRIVLVLAVFAMSAPATAEEIPHGAKPSKMAMFCNKSGQQTSGLTKVCYYDCGGAEGAITVKPYDACPRWTPRWRLNKTGQFGPSRKG